MGLKLPFYLLGKVSGGGSEIIMSALPFVQNFGLKTLDLRFGQRLDNIPISVTFEEYRDREEVLRKSGMLKGSNISITEDMSR